jgi:hypothetical protein
MGTNVIEGLSEKSRELRDPIRKVSELDIEFICAFYDKCTLPKSDSLCNQFPDFMICPDYREKRKKILNE